MKTIRRGFREALLVAAATSVLALATGAQAQNQTNNPWPYNKPERSSPVLAVVGDISCQPGAEAVDESSKETCTDPKSPYNGTNSKPPAGAAPAPPYSLWQSQEATANQIENMKPDAVALLGDLQYQVGRYSDFEQSFDTTYGGFKFLLRPAPGNHEFYDEHGETGVSGYGYFSYFNGFLINANDPNGKPLTTTISDPCPSNPCQALINGIFGTGVAGRLFPNRPRLRALRPRTISFPQRRTLVYKDAHTGRRDAVAGGWNGWALGIITRMGPGIGPGIGCATEFAIRLCTEVI